MQQRSRRKCTARGARGRDDGATGGMDQRRRPGTARATASELGTEGRRRSLTPSTPSLACTVQSSGEVAIVACLL